jgi:hypothetical protein
LLVAHGITNKLNRVINAMTGTAKLSTGRIQLVMLMPLLNHITISESRDQRDNVISTARKSVRESIMGRNLIMLKPSMVVMASLGRMPFAARRIRLPARPLCCVNAINGLSLTYLSL